MNKILLTSSLLILVAACQPPDDGGAESTTDDLRGFCTWRVKGRVQVEEEETQGTPKLRDLDGIDVRGQASLLNNGGMVYWGKVRTDASGRFEYATTRTCARRRIETSVRFHGHALTVNEPQAIDWIDVHEDGAKRSAGTIDLGNIRFSSDAPRATLRRVINRRLATTWYIVRTLMGALAKRSSWLAFQDHIHVRYPAWTPSGQSWAEGLTMTAYIQSGNGTDHWNIGTILHEVMHLWNYQHNSGTTNWAAAVWGDQSTHGFQESPNVAFHEGFASFARDALIHELWGDEMPGPPTRWWLTQKNLSSLDVLERNDDGVRYGLYWLVASHFYNRVAGIGAVNAQGIEADLVAVDRDCPATPHIDIWDVLEVFRAHPSAGWAKDWEVGNTSFGLRRFYQRAADILPQFTEDMSLLYLRMLDATDTVEPASACSLRRGR